MEDIIQKLLIICPLVFFAGFVDSIAGGGGLISLPSFLIAGLPAHTALGTNKLAMSFGTILTGFRFYKNKRVNIKSALVSVPFALIGSVLGVQIALFVDDRIFKYFIICVVPVIAFFVLKNKSMDEAPVRNYTEKTVLILSAIIGFVIGVYDGFFGPGSGTFLIIIFYYVVGFNILTASGNTKMINSASIIAALIMFTVNGNVSFALGIPAAIFSLLGNYIGSSIALKNSSKIIRPMFFVVLTLLIVKIAYDLYTG